jgi:hypothetical protein
LNKKLILINKISKYNRINIISCKIKYFYLYLFFDFFSFSLVIINIYFLFLITNFNIVIVLGFLITCIQYIFNLHLIFFIYIKIHQKTLPIQLLYKKKYHVRGEAWVKKSSEAQIQPIINVSNYDWLLEA